MSQYSTGILPRGPGNNGNERTLELEPDQKMQFNVVPRTHLLVQIYPSLFKLQIEAMKY